MLPHRLLHASSWLALSLVLLGLSACGGGGGGDSSSVNRLQPAPSINGLSVSPANAWPETPVTAQTECAGSGALTYHWNFGDGTSKDTVTPSATHVYTTGGNRSVAVTCTDETGQSTTAITLLPVSMVDIGTVATLECSGGPTGHGWCRQYPATITPSIVSAAVLDASTQFGIANGRLLKSADGARTWHEQAVPVAANLMAISAFKGQTAWAVGSNGVILKTANGGNTWQAQTSGTDQSLDHIVAVDEQTAWATNGAVILKTENAGLTWITQRQDSTALRSTALAALDRKQAWVGAGHVIWRTQDGGISWSPSTVAATGWVNSLSATAQGVIWATTSSGRLYLSQDSGQTWALSYSVPAESLGVLSKVLAMDADTAWVVGGQRALTKDDEASIFKVTHDRGRNWNAVPGTSGRWLHDITTEAGVIGWVYGAGSIFRFQDQAWNIVNQSSFAGAPISALTAINGQTAWAVGGSGTIIKTADGGVHWNVQPSGTSAMMLDVSAANAAVVWSVPEGSGLLKTSNGGTTWTTQASAEGRLNAVAAVTDNVAWAGGANNKIIKTVDGGVLWTAQTSPTNAFIQALKAIDARTAWAAGRVGTNQNQTGGVVLHTTDGATWSPVATPMSPTYGWHHLSLPSANVIWLLGTTASSSGSLTSMLLKSTDGGQNWTTCTIPENAFFNTIEALDAQIAFAGDSSGIWKSEDGCQTWRRQAIPDLSVFAIKAVNAQTLWASGKSGFIYKTLTGGD